MSGTKPKPKKATDVARKKTTQPTAKAVNEAKLKIVTPTKLNDSTNKSGIAKRDSKKPSKLPSRTKLRERVGTKEAVQDTLFMAEFVEEPPQAATRFTLPDFEDTERLEKEALASQALRKSLKSQLEKQNDDNSYEPFGCVQSGDLPLMDQEEGVLDYIRRSTEASDNSNRVKASEELISKCNTIEKVMEGLAKRWIQAQYKGDKGAAKSCKRMFKEVTDIEANLIKAATPIPNDAGRKDYDDLQEVYIVWEAPGSPVKVGLWKEADAEPSRSRFVNFLELGIAVEIPRLAVKPASPKLRLGIRVVKKDFDWSHILEDSFEGDSVPLRFGFGIETLLFPPAAVATKKWLISNVPFDIISLNNNSEVPDGSEDYKSHAGKIPLRIELTLPNHVSYEDETLGVQLWDEVDSKWKAEGVSEVKWNNTKHKLSFVSEKLSVFCVTEKNNSQFPYKWWRLTPISPCCVNLALQTKHFLIKFSIDTHGVKLNSVDPPSNELTTLYGSTHSVAELLQLLRIYGINILPGNNSKEMIEFKEFVDIRAFWETESQAYSDLAEIAPRFEIASTARKGLQSTGILQFNLCEVAEYENTGMVYSKLPSDYKTATYKERLCKVLDNVEHQNDTSQRNQQAQGSTGTKFAVTSCNEYRNWHTSLIFGLQEAGFSAQLQRQLRKDHKENFVSCLTRTLESLRLLALSE